MKAWFNIYNFNIQEKCVQRSKKEDENINPSTLEILFKILTLLLL